MALQAWQTMLSVIGGAYKERWPDDELRIIFLTTLFAGVVSAACCLLPALPAACCLLLAARCMLPTALLADASHSAIPRSLAAHYRCMFATIACTGFSRPTARPRPCAARPLRFARAACMGAERECMRICVASMRVGRISLEHAHLHDLWVWYCRVLGYLVRICGDGIWYFNLWE